MENTVTFAPELYIPNGIRDISFYIDGLGAKELRRFSNDDGTIHVSELSINGALFHLHEETKNMAAFAPSKHNGCTALIGLFVKDVDEVMNRAIAAGAIVTSPVQDYDYGYRQGVFKDPFGHLWMIEQKI